MAKRSRHSHKKKRSQLQRETLGLALVAVSVLGGLGYMHAGGVVGQAIASGVSYVVGYAAILLLLAVVASGVTLLVLRTQPLKLDIFLYALLVLLWLTTVLDSVAAAHALLTPEGGGVAGSIIDGLLTRGFGSAGRYIVLIVAALLLIAVRFRPVSGQALRFLGKGSHQGARKFGAALWDWVTEEDDETEDEHRASENREVESLQAQPSTAMASNGVDDPYAFTSSLPAATAQPSTHEVPLEPPGPAPLAAPEPLFQDDASYRLPPLSLLAKPSRERRSSRQGSQRAKLLEQTLKSFGVEVRVVDLVEGPAVTRFEVQPGPGVKVSRIVSLADDIALAMAATDVRIEAPIPGKSLVGIEVPHSEVVPVALRDVLEAASAQTGSLLTVGLGKDIAGRAIVAALDRMPHLLIAGATGSGKSVCLNTIICSLLFRCKPSEVKLVMIDPKVVELKQFDVIPHLLVPVVTDAKKAAGVLRGMLSEMELRYKKFAASGARDITRYNQIADDPMPFVVVIIDELADLMMVAPVDVEDAICRLAQMARAAGIHLVVATQRPSVDVITGLIKANIPSRIAFAVSSQVDSRTILDQGGAEKLLGKGDMLFAPLGRSKPIRAQGAYISEDEVAALLEFVSRQGEPVFDEAIAEATIQEHKPADDVDELYPDAVRVVYEAKQASASLLQRRMRVGYSRAARLIEQMEARGIVGPQDGSRPREVRLVAAEYQRLFGEQN